jgi:Arc/MetJ-type ribon-helix-helix transcriptional regulator
MARPRTEHFTFRFGDVQFMVRVSDLRRAIDRAMKSGRYATFSELFRTAITYYLELHEHPASDRLIHLAKAYDMPPGKLLAQLLDEHISKMRGQQGST